jgi:3-deoxy-7-phosphoheptulonate synthase
MKGIIFMIIVMKQDAKEEDIESLETLLKSLGLGVHVSKGQERTIVGIIGNKNLLGDVCVEIMPGVEKKIHVAESYKLVNKTFKASSTIIDVNGAKIGGTEIAIIAGPCAVESKEQILEAAIAVKKSGAKFLRGGAFKPRTSPYAFQGLEEEALIYLKYAKEQTGLNIVTEVINEHSVNIAYKYVDVFQIGARNTQNFSLLREVGKTKKPVLLKRGSSTTIDEWLNAAEYIVSEGNPNVILCERGIRTFETATRNTLDISSIPIIKNASHLPILVDPSHAAGKTLFVPSLSRASIAAGADGLIVEVHPDPLHALSDASQQLTPDEFELLCMEVKKIAVAVGREFDNADR